MLLTITATGMRSTLPSPHCFSMLSPRCLRSSVPHHSQIFLLPVPVVLLSFCLNLTVRSIFTTPVCFCPAFHSGSGDGEVSHRNGEANIRTGFLISCLNCHPSSLLPGSGSTRWHLSNRGLGLQYSHSLTLDCPWRVHDLSSRRA